ncbi:MAG: 2-amino-4-ketopentanoate thiolase [Clostridiales bacterium]|nr:MAG: 2-amino-4-ketopentanoate thiolase [Clostridiales bacterium]
MAKKGDYVNVYNVVLSPAERAPQVPDDTKKVPLEMWVRGFLTADAELNQEATIKTITGREVTGKLVEENPTYRHSFGEHVPEIFQIGIQLKGLLFGGDQ